MILATCQHHILKTYTVQIEFRTVVHCLFHQTSLSRDEDWISHSSWKSFFSGTLHARPKTSTSGKIFPPIKRSGRYHSQCCNMIIFNAGWEIHEWHLGKRRCCHRHHRLLWKSLAQVRTSQVPQPTCYWKWHSWQLGNLTNVGHALTKSCCRISANVYSSKEDYINLKEALLRNIPL